MIYTNKPTHPGIHLKDTMDTLNLTQTQMADRTGLTRKTINEIVLGKAGISPKNAFLFEKVLGVPSSFWINLQKNYDMNVEYLKLNTFIERQSKMLDKFPIREMCKFKFIKCTSKDKNELTNNILNYFGVANFDYLKNNLLISWRKSIKKNPDFFSLVSWIRAGELMANNLETKEFNKQSLESFIPVFRSLSRLEPNIFTQQIRNLCSDSGVAVAFVPELPKTYVSGAALWLTSVKAAMFLSLRFKSNDHFWFSFFHELGHILLHGKNDSFLDYDNNPSSKKEIEADEFAANSLIPINEWSKFIQKSKFTHDYVSNFASEIDIAPGIIVGRLQKENYIPFSYLNKLKKYYEWNLS
jgi:HTH-type transcriptional regulator / antitoxin HigA